MAGPTLVIEFAEPVPSAALSEFSALMRRLSSHFEQRRHGYFDVNVPLERLGASTAHDAQGVDGRRPFLVCLMGPGAGDESVFEAEHADEPEVEAVLGFKPTHAVNVSAGCNDRIDHVATALLTAAVVDVLGVWSRLNCRKDRRRWSLVFPECWASPTRGAQWCSALRSSSGPGSTSPASGWSSSPATGGQVRLSGNDGTCRPTGFPSHCVCGHAPCAERPGRQGGERWCCASTGSAALRGVLRPQPSSGAS